MTAVLEQPQEQQATGTDPAATFNRGELAAALAACLPVTKAKRFKEILGCVRLTIDADAVHMDATDLEQSVRITLRQVQPESAGALCIDRAELAALLDRMPDDVVRISAAARTMRAEIVGSSRHGRPVMDPAGWPPLSDFPEPAGAAAGANVLRLIRQTQFAQADTDSTYGRRGVELVAKGGRLRMTGTDANRMAAADCPWDGADFAAVRVPPAALVTLAKAADPEQPVGVAADDRAAYFRSGDVWHRTGLIDGNAFPACDELLARVESGSDKRLTADRAALLDAVRLACVSADGERPNLRLDLGPDGLTLAARADARGGSVPFPCEYDGAPLAIGLNGQWWAEGIAAATGEVVTVRFREPYAATLLQERAADGSYSFLLQPFNLG